MDREELEIAAQALCPAALWYELLDTLEETPDSDLVKLIEKHSQE